MKVLQVPFHYYPDAVGGTEVYVTALAREILNRGVDVEIAAPGEHAEQYVHEGILVHRFGLTREPEDVAMLYGEGDPEATRQFAMILDRIRPDMVHLHAMSPAISMELPKEIKRRGIPVIFTCHIPGIICSRGTLLHYGKHVCDGAWDLNKCTACCLEVRGIPAGLAGPAALLPVGFGDFIGELGIRGSAVTALRMKSLQAVRRRNLIEFFSHTDRVMAVSGWLRDVLVRNGVDPKKIVLCRHGSTQAPSDPSAVITTRGGVLQIAYLGRIDATKGVHTLIEALRLRPRLAVRLDIYGILQDSVEYSQQIRRSVGNDHRIVFLPPVSNSQLIAKLRRYDAVAVPSLWLETGPLVVYDAFAAGIPVIGSSRGGIAELVTHEQDGLLVEPGNAEAWGAALERFCNDDGLRNRLRAGVRPPRTMAEVAQDVMELYAELADAAGLTTRMSAIS